MSPASPFKFSLCAAALCALLAAGAVTAQSSRTLETVIDGPVLPLEGCDGGVVKDDSMPESGYGWVPSAIDGIYVQKFENSELSRPVVDEVCICFLRTRDDDSINFEVVFYRDVDGDPEEEPYASFPVFLDGVPEGSGSGKFAEVPTPGVMVPPGTFYVGARWDPSADQFFFVCDDQSEETERVNIWFRDDRAEGWDNADETNDSIFDAHRAMLIRIVGSEAPLTDVPLLAGRGLALLAGLLLLAGVALLRRLN